ncbi:MAG: NAD(P)/FAD-dependent oxidoreductase, partial [Lentisphaeria bacterium]
NSFNFFIKPLSFYNENNINFLLSEKVNKILFDSQEVISNNYHLKYDKLLIATGASCFCPTFAEPNLQTPFTLRDYNDFNKISNALINPPQHVVIIGGGVLGLELAESCRKKNHHVTILEMTQYLLMRNLPSQASSIIAKILHDNQIILHCNIAIQALNAHSVMLNNGSNFESSITIISAGARARVELANNSLNTNRFGICINEYMQTSHPNVFAAGDCASLCNTPINGLWNPAKRQGEIAAINMTGLKQPYLCTHEPLLLSIFGSKIFSIGSFLEPNQFTKIIFQSSSQLIAVSTVNDIIVAACSINNQAITSKLKKAYDDKLTISQAKDAKLL